MNRGLSIEQGPAWIADLYFAPPVWVNLAIQTLSVIAIAYTLYRLYQSNWQIDVTTQKHMQGTVATFAMVLTAVLVMVNFAHQPYLIDVVSGFALGYGPVVIAQSRVVDVSWPKALSDSTDRMGVTWLLLAGLTYGLPALAYAGKGVMLGNSKLILTVVCGLMALYNALISEG